VFKIEKLKSLSSSFYKTMYIGNSFFLQKKKFDAMKRIQKKEFTGLIGEF